jgi:hypothetical protein
MHGINLISATLKRFIEGAYKRPDIILAVFHRMMMYCLGGESPPGFSGGMPAEASALFNFMVISPNVHASDITVYAHLSDIIFAFSRNNSKANFSTKVSQLASPPPCAARTLRKSIIACLRPSGFPNLPFTRMHLPTARKLVVISISTRRVARCPHVATHTGVHPAESANIPTSSALIQSSPTILLEERNFCRTRILLMLKINGEVTNDAKGGMY